MSQCIPSWDVDNNIPTAPRVPFRSHSHSTARDVPMFDYEVAELRWENGQLSMHGIGPPRVPAKPLNAATRNPTLEKPRSSGTLESIVNQATRLPHHTKDDVGGGGGGGYRNEFVPWFDPHSATTASSAAASASAANTVAMDALVPCFNSTEEPSMQAVMESGRVGTCTAGCSARVASCGGTATRKDDGVFAGKSTMAAARGPLAHELSSRDKSASVNGSATCDWELGVGFTSASMGSPENTSSYCKQCTMATTNDDHDSVCHRKSQRGDEDDKTKGAEKSSVSTKRKRTAAMHNQSERKRRDKINQRLKTLQKLVPNSSKTDKASLLDEAIEYLKQLQAQVQMMNRMKMSSMMLPLITMQQQLQMSMMAQLGIGMGMRMGMDVDMNNMNIPGIPPILNPTPFMPMASWDGCGGDRLQGTPGTPMGKDAYSMMASLYQQLHQPPASSSKS